jgi:Anti-sigma-K factor rskA, C-terminal/Putative zinc-finger
MSGWQPEPHTLVGAYAMDALDGPDRARFEQHLNRCRECTGEVAGLREAAARLAVAAAARPPAALRGLLLAETALTRQLPPVTTGARGAGARRHVPGQGAHRFRPRTPRLARLLAGAAGLAVAAIWAGSAAVRPAQPGPPAGSHAIATVLTAPDLSMVSGRVRTGGTATVMMSHRERMLVFTATGLRPLPGSRRYELWLMEPGRDRPAALLPMPSHGMSGPVVTSGLRPGDQLGLTVEPATGSRRPSSPMILVLAL